MDKIKIASQVLNADDANGAGVAATAGARAAKALRELALRAVWNMKGVAALEAHAPSEDLARAIMDFDIPAAQAAWNQEGRFERASSSHPVAESMRHMGPASKMWANGWAFSKGDKPAEALAMAEWIDAKGALFAQRHKKNDEVAAGCDRGSPEWVELRIEAAKTWPKCFVGVESMAPGAEETLRAMATGWIKSGVIDREGAQRMATAALTGVLGRMEPLKGVPLGSGEPLDAKRLAWAAWALDKDGLGGAMPDLMWLALLNRAEGDAGSEMARSALERSAHSPHPDILRRIAAMGAARGDPLLLAAAAERHPSWDWMVDLKTAATEATKQLGTALPTIAGWPSEGKVSALHAAAMGAKGRRPWNNAGLMALLSIPEARAAAKSAPHPMALLHWGPLDVEWVTQAAPELLERDKKGRTIAHAWAAGLGSGAVKRVAALAQNDNGWMIGASDDSGVSPMELLREHGRIKDLAAIFSRWEAGVLEASADEPPEAAARSAPRL